MRVRVLGPVGLDAGGGPVDVGPKERTVLAALAAAANVTLSTDFLVDALWGGRAPRTAERTVGGYISRLRAKLSGGPAIERRGGGFCLVADGDQLDSLAAEADVVAGRAARAAGDMPAAIEHFRRAEARWRGPSFGEFAAEPYARAAAARLDELRWSAVEERVEVELAAGRHQALVAELEQLCTEAPLRERLWRHKMLAQYRAGRQADALRSYQNLRRMLAEELGLEPSAELRALEQAILTQSLDLDVGAPATVPQPLVRPHAPPSLPAGLMTFLISDVEGSTRAFQRLGEGYPRLLAEAMEAFAEAISAHGGIIVKTTGDGVLAAFVDAAAACRAAVEGQRTHLAERHRHSGEDEGSGVELRVRVGVHSGECVAVGGDYISLAVHQADRIASAARGDQILVSEFTRGLVMSGLDPGVELAELGEYWLKDFDSPARLFQLTADELPRTLLPLRAPRVADADLPFARTSFVGRDDELLDLRALLARERLVVVTGLGGTGKTRLALRAAHELASAFADGVWMVELGSVASADAVPGAIAGALGIVEQPGEQPEDALVCRLRPQRALLLLDAAENAVVGLRRIVPLLLDSCPGVTLLVTSRVPLGIAGQRNWPLAPMAVPDDANSLGAGALMESDSARLFVERGVAARVGFTVTDGNAPAIARICRRLGGIPLAIELAAARLKVLTPEKLAQRLEDRLSVLGGATDGRTLDAVIEWSWRLLGDDEQVLLRRLSVFPGGAGLEAVEEVCTGGALDGGAVIDVLSQLLDKSLIRFSERHGEPRYGMLDAVRDVAADRLAFSDDYDEVLSRFVRWCGDFALRVSWADEATDHHRWLDRADAEVDNMRAALVLAAETGNADSLTRLSTRLSGYWQMRGRYAEARRWLGEAVELHRANGSRDNFLWCRYAWFEMVVRNEAAAEPLFREVADSAPTTDDWLPSALLGLAEVAHRRREAAVARGYAERALAVARETKSEVDELSALADLGKMDWAEGDLDAARNQFERLRTIVRAKGDTRRESNCLLNIAGLAVESEHADAEQRAIEAVAACREFGERDALADALGYLGAVHARSGRADEACALLAEAVAITRDTGLTLPWAFALAGYGWALAAAGDRKRAYDVAVEGLRLLRDCPDQQPAVGLLRTLAVLWTDVDARVARALLTGSLVVERALVPVPSPQSRRDAADIQRRLGVPDATADANDAAEGSADRSDHPASVIAWALSLRPPHDPLIC